MSILTATNLSQSHGFTDVFTDISVSITADAKAGLIGPNGVGKTTLLRVLAAIDKPVTGSVTLAKGKRVGYLPQEAMDAFAGDANTVYAEMLTAFEHLHTLEARMRDLEKTMAGDVEATLVVVPAQDSGQGQALLLQQRTALDEYGDLQDQFTHGGGYEVETRIKQTLDGLGFNRANWDTPVTHLSGGQKTRALLAKLLLEKPDLLILDEPTNHLDVDALEWLEKTLIAWDGALLICSHDRLFLDRVVNRIWEMSRTKVEVYRGNYTAYTQQREERFQRSLFVFNQVKADFENELRVIKRDLDAVKAGNSDKSVTWAKGRLRLLSRRVQTVEAVGAEALMNGKWQETAAELGPMPAVYTYDEAERHVRGLRAPARPQRVKLALSSTKRGSEITLWTKHLRVGYPGNPLFECGDIELRWKDRTALIGPNGAGKTTFIKTALGAIAPLKGEVELGPSIIAGYFAQAHDELNPDARIIEEVQKHKRMSDGETRHYLVQFLFSQDDVFKPIGGLSGGERARLALAILQLRGANLLVLDEPTNHLDITAQEELEAALDGYDGTILLVSHDRYLISKLATHIWHIEGGRMHVFRGTYVEWMKFRAQTLLSAEEGMGERVRGLDTQRTSSPAPNLPQAESVQAGHSTSSKGRGGQPKNAERKRQQHIAEAETRIAALEGKLNELTVAMQENKGTYEVASLGIEYALAQRELDEAMKQWEIASTDGTG